ncbi:MAG: hypothetical protein NT082_00885 [Chloroflexi bacterium]|nr:hypothetical protein [Chloroflexota bacterium]
MKLSWLTVILLAFICTACAQQAAPPPTSTTSGSQTPVIESLMPAQNQTYPGGMVDIKSKLNYAGKEVVNYKWSCSGGNFRDTGANAVWVAPQQYGNYDITLAVDDGKGGTSQASVTITVSANHPPQITSVKADPSGVQLEGVTTLTCVASDEDGDPITYSWTAKEGTVSGQGNKVSWAAPRKQGSFSIIAIAKDNKGGESTQEVVVLVSSASSAMTLNLVKPESGTVDSAGDKDTSIYKAGDDEKDIGYRAFFTFNILPLKGMEIRQATLKFIGTKVSGDPYDPTTGIGDFQIRHFSYGNKLPNFSIMEGGPVERAETQYNKPLTDVDVTPELVNDVANKQERFQVEAAFMKKATNGNAKAEFVQWSDVVLEVTAAPK